MNGGIESRQSIEFKEKVLHDKPFKGRRPTIEDEKDPNEMKNRFDNMPVDDTFEMKKVIPINNDTLEMDDVEKADDMLEIGEIRKRIQNNALEIRSANADNLEMDELNDTLEIESARPVMSNETEKRIINQYNNTLEMEKPRKIGTIEKFTNYLKEKLNI